MTGKPRQYIAYLLRLWRVSGAEPAAWRASLEDPHTGERKGFTSLESLFTFVREQINSSTEPADESSSTDP